MSLVLLNLVLLVPPFDPDPTRWIAVPVPLKTPAGDRDVWEYAANYSKLEWRVVAGKDGVRASLDGERPLLPSDLPATIERSRGRTALRADDGWLVGMNRGEWGGSLSWISPDGKKKKQISHDQIVAFFRLPEGMYAVEGLAHMTLSYGSILRIEKPSPKAPWRVKKVLNLPKAPNAAAVRKDGTVLLVLTDRVAAFRTGTSLQTLLPDAPWWGLYPNSAALSADETKLYIGMRQFVGELDLRTNALRLLVPSLAHLNQLSKDSERSVRFHASRSPISVSPNPPRHS